MLPPFRSDPRRLRVQQLESRQMLAGDDGFSAAFADLDANLDGEVNSSDVRFLGERLSHSNIESRRGLNYASTWDLNRDGKLSARDPLFLVNHLDDQSVSTMALGESPDEGLQAESLSSGELASESSLTPASWIAHHALTETSLDSLVSQYAGNGFRPVRISGYERAGQQLFAAVWHPIDGVTWSASYAMTAGEYQQEFSNRVGAGYRATDVNGYSIGGVDYYAAVFEQKSGPNWFARHRATGAAIQQVFNENVPLGYRSTNFSGYRNGSVDNYSAIFEINDGRSWGARNGMNAAGFQTQLNNFSAAGYDLVDVSGYVINGVDYYTAVWEVIDTLETVSRYAMTEAEYQGEFNARVSQGYTLIDVDGYTINGVDYYAAVWGVSTPPFSAVPVTGESISLLDPVDAAVEQFMVDRQISSGSVAISKDGQLLYEKSFGWSDEGLQNELGTGAMFRLASVVKPITAAATRNLIAAEQLSLSDQVFCTTASPNNCLLDVQPFTTPDSRLTDITVNHLLNHTGGWDRSVSGDPLFDQLAIANTMGIASPPSKHSIASYFAGRPLDFNPGARYAYSNFGYLVLGLVIEEVTGQPYTPYIQDTIFNPIGVADSEIELGRSLPENRNPREPWYDDPANGTNLFNTSEFVPFPDGAFHIESMDSLGGQIASAPAIASFLDNYWISGNPRGNGSASYTFYGSLPGTATMARQRPDGLNVVVLFNNRRDTTGAVYDQGLLRQTMDQVLDGIQWPEPAVLSVELNQGAGARSQLTSVKLDFDADVDVNELQNAFTLTNVTTGTQVTSLMIQTTASPSGTTATIHFGDGPSVETRLGSGDLGNSLADGLYRLDVDSDFVSGAYFGRPMSSDFSFGDDTATDNFFRLFGDSDGDKDVDGHDYRRFVPSFLKSAGVAEFDPRFDADGDGDVDGRDLGRFRRSLNKSI